MCLQDVDQTQQVGTWSVYILYSILNHEFELKHFYERTFINIRLFSCTFAEEKISFVKTATGKREN